MEGMSPALALMKFQQAEISEMDREGIVIATAHSDCTTVGQLVY